MTETPFPITKTVLTPHPDLEGVIYFRNRPQDVPEELKARDGVFEMPVVGDDDHKNFLVTIAAIEAGTAVGINLYDGSAISKEELV